MDRTDSRLAPSPETASDDVASSLNLQAGQDLLDFEPVPLRFRSDGLTPEKQRAYVEALADTGVARAAAARIGVSEQSINRVRRRPDGRDFDRACEAAHMFGARRLRSIAYERAIEGTLKGHYYHGERVGEERVYDNRLLIYLLGKTEHLLQAPKECGAICDNWQEHMEALERGEEPLGLTPGFAGDGLDSSVWEDEETGVLLTTFPPPDGFDGEERGVWDGVGWYCRSLTPAEQAAIAAREAEDIAEARARECARRDRFFGFAGDGISSPWEAEPYEGSETSEEEEEEPDRGESPIEYKSMVPLPVIPAKAGTHERRPSRSARPCSWISDQVRDGASACAPTSNRPIPGILADEPPGAVA